MNRDTSHLVPNDIVHERLAVKTFPAWVETSCHWQACSPVLEPRETVSRRLNGHCVAHIFFIRA